MGAWGGWAVVGGDGGFDGVTEGDVLGDGGFEFAGDVDLGEGSGGEDEEAFDVSAWSVVVALEGAGDGLRGGLGGGRGGVCVAEVAEARVAATATHRRQLSGVSFFMGLSSFEWEVKKIRFLLLGSMRRGGSGDLHRILAFDFGEGDTDDAEEGEDGAGESGDAADEALGLDAVPAFHSGVLGRALFGRAVVIGAAWTAGEALLIAHAGAAVLGAALLGAAARGELIGLGLVILLEESVGGDIVDVIGGGVEEGTGDGDADAEDEGEDALAEGEEPAGHEAGHGGDAFFEGGLKEAELLAVTGESDEYPPPHQENGGGNSETAGDDFPYHSSWHVALQC